MSLKVELLAANGTDSDVARAALASSGKDIPQEKIERLIEKLVKEKHESCFEHITYTFNIKAPLYILNQITRHRVGMSYNQASRRYKYPFESYYKLPLDVRWQIEPDDAFEYEFLCSKALDFYKRMAQKYNKRVNEVLSGALPVAVMSSLTLSCNLRSFIHFYSLRADEHAQKEIQYIAIRMRELIEEQGKTPILFKQLEKHRWGVAIDV